MMSIIAASLLSLQLAAGGSPTPAPGKAAAPAEIPADWTSAPTKPVATPAAIRAAVAETIAAERAAEGEALPTYRFSSQPPPDRYQVFADIFDDARVPDCLHADGLKRQSTLIFKGLVALPFVAIAKLRGKCN